jgi:SET domain-containing protein
MLHSVESQKALLHQKNLHLRELNCIHSKHHLAQHNLQNFRLPVLAFKFSHHQTHSLSTAIKKLLPAVGFRSHSRIIHGIKSYAKIHISFKIIG